MKRFAASTLLWISLLPCNLFALPTPEQIVTQHAILLDAYQNLHVRFENRLVRTDAYVAALKANFEKQKASASEIAARSPELTEDDIRKQAEDGIANIEAARETRSQIDYYRQGENAFQIRMPKGTLAGIDGPWDAPRGFASGASLLNEFRDTWIYTASPMRHRNCVWVSSQMGAITSKAPVRCDSRVRFPPFSKWLQSLFSVSHPIDDFLGQPADQYRVIDLVAEDGEELVLVELRAPYRGRTIGTLTEDGTPKQLDEVRFYRCWLDPDRHFLPVRMHVWLSHAGVKFEDLPTHPHYIVKTTRFETVKGMPYPSTTIREEIHARESDADFEVHGRETWNCSLVERDVVLNDQFFAMEFPSTVEIYDLDTGHPVDALPPRPAIQPGTPAPALQVAQWFDGSSRDLSDFHGDVVVLKFWGMWCGPCLDEVDAMKSLQEKYRDRPVHFVSIHTADADPNETLKQILRFVGNKKWSTIGAIDLGTGLESSVTTNAYGVTAFPCHIIIGRSGRVAFNSQVDILDKAARAERLKEIAESAQLDWPPPKMSRDEAREFANRMFIQELAPEIDAALGQ